MNARSFAVLLLAFFANFKGFESAEISDLSPQSSTSTSSSHSSSGSSESGRIRMFDLVRDREDLVKRSRTGLEGEFWNALEEKDYKAAKQIKRRRGFRLESRDQENLDNITMLLASDETPLDTLEYLYKEHPQFFRDFGNIEDSESPFYFATQKNIDHLIENHSDDLQMMLKIQEANKARMAERIDGTTVSY